MRSRSIGIHPVVVGGDSPISSCQHEDASRSCSGEAGALGQDVELCHPLHIGASHGKRRAPSRAPQTQAARYNKGVPVLRHVPAPGRRDHPAGVEVHQRPRLRHDPGRARRQGSAPERAERVTVADLGESLRGSGQLRFISCLAARTEVAGYDVRGRDQWQRGQERGSSLARAMMARPAARVAGHSSDEIGAFPLKVGGVTAGTSLARRRM
jgi:hypothetical protein